MGGETRADNPTRVSRPSIEKIPDPHVLELPLEPGLVLVRVGCAERVRRSTRYRRVLPPGGLLDDAVESAVDVARRRR